MRKQFLRHFSLPRPDCLKYHFIDDTPDSPNASYNLHDYLTQPWYVKPTLWSRWGPGSWISRLLGFKLPGDEGP